MLKYCLTKNPVMLFDANITADQDGWYKVNLVPFNDGNLGFLNAPSSAIDIDSEIETVIISKGHVDHSPITSNDGSLPATLSPFSPKFMEAGILYYNAKILLWVEWQTSMQLTNKHTTVGIAKHIRAYLHKFGSTTYVAPPPTRTK